MSFHANVSESDQERQLKDPNFPWTFWPECYANEDTTEPICVFTQQSFSHNRGIFLVTTSAEAYRLLKTDAFNKPPEHDQTDVYENPPYMVVDMPGKGRGLIANKTLNRGDRIFASTPLLISNPEAYELSDHERIRLATRGVDTLPQKSKDLFWTLLDHFKGDPVEDRIYTNAFDITLGGVSYHTVLPEIAMTNHDCRPNAAYFFDERTLTQYMHATQTIYPGEEITITYINNERVREKRVRNLKTNWGFDCSCSACSAHDALVAESDARIEQIDDITLLLDDWTSKSVATPELAELLIALYEQERLWASLGLAYKYAAETYSSFGEKWKAVKYARMSIELSILDKGWKDRDVVEMQRMADQLEMTWSWNKRVGLGAGKKMECGCGGHGHGKE
ncbi:SET domain-containing protein [Amniculicola lignicola CBS 123094]|uniref:SET domain-containing protein n=1 Tax=Amniculicola lignicola CBS 123094 TaxID=1392246 RepID=A0A6A5W8X4_9PLEO|nr:SET domain-containing protein [Amniculicola lignicola CBS 123094]